MMIKTSKLLLKHQLCLERRRDQKLKCLICHSFLSFLAKRCLEMTFFTSWILLYEIKPHKVWLFLPQALFLLLIKLSSIARNKWQWWQQQKTKEIHSIKTRTKHFSEHRTWYENREELWLELVPLFNRIRMGFDGMIIDFST